MNKKIYNKIKVLSHFIWLILLIVIVSSVTYFYDNNKKNQSRLLKKTFSNIYLQKTLVKIASELKPRFLKINYKVKERDTYESIINKINIPKKEKKLFLETVKKNKNLKILKLNQTIFFKIDKRNFQK